MFDRLDSKRVLFVWDGTNRSIEIADRFVRSQGKNVIVHCLRVLPHESLCAYATVGYAELEPLAPERKIRIQFENAIALSAHLSGCKLEIIFGERINEIVRFAEFAKTNTILMPTFSQSRFSNWIHGNLNQRVAEQARCHILFYESDSDELSDQPAAPPKSGELN